MGLSSSLALTELSSLHDKQGTRLTPGCLMIYNISTKSFLEDNSPQILRLGGISDDDLLRLHAMIRLEDTTPPTPGDFQVVQEIEPVRVTTDGVTKFHRQYTVVEMFLSSRQEKDPETGENVEISVSQLQDRFMKRSVIPLTRRVIKDIMETRFLRHKDTGITTSLGFSVDGSDVSLSLLTMADRILSSPPGAEKAFVMGVGGVVRSLTATQLSIVRSDVQNYFQSLMESLSFIMEAVDRQTTPSGCKKVELAAHRCLPSLDVRVSKPSFFIESNLHLDHTSMDLQFFEFNLPKTQISDLTFEYDLKSLVPDGSLAICVRSVLGLPEGSVFTSIGGNPTLRIEFPATVESSVDLSLSLLKLG